MNTRTVYTMYAVNDADKVDMEQWSQAYDLDQLREYADYQEGLDRRVIIMDQHGKTVYLSPARRTAMYNISSEYATLDQIRAIRDLLVERDLIAETRPAYRRRMQQIKSDMSILDTLTFEQASALWDSLLALPVSDAIDHTAFSNALHGYTETAYEERCHEDIAKAYSAGMCSLGANEHMALMSFTY